MRNRPWIIGLLALGFQTWKVTAQSPSDLHPTQLCELQMKVGQGEIRKVQVEGVYLAGLEGQYVVAPDCSGRSTAVEFDLKSHQLWKRLVQMSNVANAQKHASGNGDPVLVVFDGDFYGPRAPDPKLPDAIRQNYHPGWDHNNVSMTKLVVHTIRQVEALPAGHPCAPTKSAPGQWPCFSSPRQP